MAVTRTYEEAVKTIFCTENGRCVVAYKPNDINDRFKKYARQPHTYYHTLPNHDEHI